MNSILMLGSTYGKKKIVNIIFTVLWIINMIFITGLKTGLSFTIINISAFLLVVLLASRIKGKYSKTCFSVLSILAWSVLIDVICYFMYPAFSSGFNIVTYVMNGILFNYKYIFYNVLVVSVIHLVKYAVNSKVAKKVTVNN